MEQRNTRKIRDPWPEEVRIKALELYLKQDRPNLIDISAELDIPETTLVYWRKVDDWVKQRKSLFTSTSELVFSDLLSEMTQERRQVYEDYKKIRDKAIKGVEDDSLEFKDKKQASDSLAMSLREMNTILEKSVPLILLQEVAEIILDEVEDEDTKSRIGQRLVSLGSSWSARDSSK